MPQAGSAGGGICSRQRLSSGAASPVQMQREMLHLRRSLPPAAAGRPASRPHSAGAGRYILYHQHVSRWFCRLSSTSRPVTRLHIFPDRDGPRPIRRCATRAALAPVPEPECLGIERIRNEQLIAAPASRHAHGVHGAQTAVSCCPAPALTLSIFTALIASRPRAIDARHYWISDEWRSLNNGDGAGSRRCGCRLAKTPSRHPHRGEISLCSTAAGPAALAVPLQTRQRQAALLPIKRDSGRRILPADLVAVRRVERR